MYTIDLGKWSNSTSTLKIDGLPPLKLNIHENGYFDGWITHAQDRDHIWLTQKFDSIEAMSRKVSKQHPKIALQNAQSGELAILKMVDTWERVLIVERTETNRAKIYLIDRGSIKEVDINNLYQMNNNLRNVQPLAFPVSIDSSAPSFGEIPMQDWLALEGVRVAVKIGKLHDSTITCNKFTIFDAESSANLPLLNAVTNRKKRFQRAVPVPLPLDPTYPSSSQPQLTTPNSTNSEKHTGLYLGVFGLCACAIFLVIAGLIVYFMKGKRKRPVNEEEPKDPSPTDIGSLKKNPEAPSKPQLRNDDVLEMDASTVATLIATMGHGKYEAERRSKRDHATDRTQDEDGQDLSPANRGMNSVDRLGGGRSPATFSNIAPSSEVFMTSYHTGISSPHQSAVTVEGSPQDQDVPNVSFWDLTQRGVSARTGWSVAHPNISSIYSESNQASTDQHASLACSTDRYDSSGNADSDGPLSDIEPSDISDISEVHKILRCFEKKSQTTSSGTSDMGSAMEFNARGYRKKMRIMAPTLPTLNETLDSYYSANSRPSSESSF